MELRRRDVLRTAGSALGAAGLAGLASGESDCAGKRTSADDLPFDTDGYGGWGGHEFHGTDAGRSNPPVVFAHGNTRDACDFSKHAGYFLERDYRGDALWSVTFREETSTHPEMRDQLESFVSNVVSYTSASSVDLVAHSLGVTGVRFWLAEGDRYGDVGTVVGAAGANHGTSTCPTCDAYPGTGEPCQFISPQCADEEGEPLYDLNHPDETPGDVDYYTIRGTQDAFYPVNLESPELDGAERNLVLDGADHDETRESDRAVAAIYEFVTA